MIERLKALYRRIQRKMSEYPISDADEVSLAVGVDDRGIIHTLTWKFDDTQGLLQGRCGASITVKTRGTVDCMTCLVKEPR